MLFKRLAEYFQELEKTTLRNKMTEILASLFKEASSEEIGKICYLLQGRVVPLYEAIEFGVADKMMIKAVAQGLNLERKQVLDAFKKEGDLGSATANLKSQISNLKTTAKNLNLIEVFRILRKVAETGGEGSQEEKINLLAGLIKKVDPLSARYLVRIPLGKLRLGFSDMTVLDALSWVLIGSKDKRKEIERAYNVRPDLGFIAVQVKKNGLKRLEKIKPVVGTPILMARANRLSSSFEILKKIGKCAVESKYDGLRLQVHYRKVRSGKLEVGSGKKGKEKDFVRLFSRNLEELTQMFPDIVRAVRKQVKAREVIFEGEIVAYNPKTGVSVAFQQTMQRRRKYDIEKKAAEIPVKLFVFELLYLNGQNFINRSYIERKAALKKIINPGKVIIFTDETVTEEEGKIDELFGVSVKEGYEGIIAKRLDGVYQAGMRGWNWIKYKKAMSKKLMDTFDVVVMGYNRGEGKRITFGIGEFLTGIRDRQGDQFVSISKIGTGLTDEQFRQLKKRMSKLETGKKPKEYKIDKLLTMDVWLTPSLVVEIGADEITRSQVHTAGRVMGPSKSGTAQKVKEPGFSLRFPKLERFRDDRRPEDATSLSEVRRMYQMQGK